MHTLSPEELDHLLTTLPDPTAGNEPLSNTSFLELFVPLGREQLSRLITEQTCKRGEVLFWENEPGDAMYIIHSGMAVALKGKLDAPTFLGYRGPGEVMGEMALIENQPRSATAVVLKEGRMMRISREDFQQMMHILPEIGMNIMKEMSRRLRVSDNARHSIVVDARQLVHQVSELQSEKQQLIELQRLRQETSDLIVHDLRNPLQNILGTLQLMPVVLPENIWQENKELLEIAMYGCERMQLLINTLLDVARMENGEMRLELSAISLPGLIDGVIRRMTSFTRGDIRLKMSFPALPPNVMADQNILERILTNLIDNAVKHTPLGGLITISAEAQKDEMRISVTDTGPGIPPEDRERIFERFAQTIGEKGRRRGFGLGLTFCRLAVSAHGGRIWVEPGEEGKGSCFIFTLPLSATA